MQLNKHGLALTPQGEISRSCWLKMLYEMDQASRPQLPLFSVLQSQSS